MSRNDFKWVLRNIHLEDSAYAPRGVVGGGRVWRDWRPRRGTAGYDPAAKVRRWKELINNSFRRNYDPGRDLSFDEMMVASVARIAFRVFMRGKPVKRGFKLWSICDAVTRPVLAAACWLNAEHTGCLRPVAACVQVAK